MYAMVGEVDAVVCCAGSAPMTSLAEMTTGDLQAACPNRLLGQVELARQGIRHIRDGGSTTLVSGVGAASDRPRGLRINSVSATLFEEAAQAYAPAFPGFVPVSTSVIAQAYVKSMLSGQTGRVYRIGY